MDPTTDAPLELTGWRGSLQKTFLSLRNRNFRLFFIGQIISNTGNWLTNIALTLLVLKITHSGLAVGVLAAFSYGPILLFSAYAGAVADRVDKRKMLLATQSLEMLESAGLAVLAFLPHPPLYGLYALALVGGTLLSFDSPLRRSFVSEMVPARDAPNAIILNTIIVNSSRIFGPALAGLLIITVGYGWCFALDAASYVAVIASLLLMRASELHRAAPRPRGRGEVRAGLRYVRHTPPLAISFAMLALIGVLAYNFNVTLPLFVTGTLHRSNGTFTLLYSLFSVGAVAGGLLVARRTLVGLRNVIQGAAGLGVAMLLLGIVPNIQGAVPVMMLLGVTSVLFMTAVTAMVQLQTKPEFRGRVLALQAILLFGTNPIGGPILGALADAFGSRSPMLVGGVACLVAASFGWLAMRRMAVS